jgi:hypothetical protein
MHAYIRGTVKRVMSDEFKKQLIPGGVLWRHPTLEQSMAAMQQRYAKDAPAAGRPLSDEEVAEIRRVRYTAETMSTSNKQLAERYGTSELFVQMAASDAKEQHKEKRRRRREIMSGDAPSPTPAKKTQHMPQVKSTLAPRDLRPPKNKTRYGQVVDKSKGNFPSVPY